ncbi:MAG: hypothetical protein LBR22_02240 [Desulfovibrio sp.]|jgi:hypothetical protein|nr:hypothetical protein [Desulfovibrio sp.]
MTFLRTGVAAASACVLWLAFAGTCGASSTSAAPGDAPKAAGEGSGRMIPSRTFRLPDLITPQPEDTPGGEAPWEYRFEGVKEGPTKNTGPKPEAQTKTQ